MRKQRQPLVEALERRELLTITVQFTTFNLGGAAEPATLATNGWVGVLVTAVSNANPIGGFDLDSNSWGITANMAQITAFVAGTPFATPAGTVPGTPAGSI